MRLLTLLLLGLPTLLPAAALVPAPAPPKTPSFAEIQPNKGQAAPGILFQTRGTTSIAAQGASILFSPFGTQQNFSGGNSNPQVSFSDTLPGVSHEYSGANSQNWITNIPRYATAHLAAIYPGVDVEYSLDTSGNLTLRLLLAPNADLNQVIFEFPAALSLHVNPAAPTIGAQFFSSSIGPELTYGPPVSSTQITIERLSSKSFRLTAPQRDIGAPLRIDLPFTFNYTPPAPLNFTSDASNLWTAALVLDAAGKPDPFPATDGVGCGFGGPYPIACNDVAVYKLSPAGDVLSVTYLSGSFDESPAFIGVAPGGGVVVTGATDSTDFPISSNAYQTSYAGPATTPDASTGRSPASDYFALALDPATGTLRASTYLGGPNPDVVGESVIAADGSLYFLTSTATNMAGMPTTPGALMRECAETGTGINATRCLNGYVAHLSADLSQLIFGTYIPGAIGATMRVHSDGSVYFAGGAGSNVPSFQPTPNAFQTTLSGPSDGIVGRLDPAGSNLLFATYLGGPRYDTVRQNAVAPDGSVWVTLSSYDPCCSDGDEYHLVRFDAEGKNKLVDLPINVGDIATDQDGNLLAITGIPLAPSSNALLTSPCTSNEPGYARFSPIGQLLFFTYLPPASPYFDGRGSHGLPIVAFGAALNGSTRFEILEDQNMGILAGCMVDAGSYTAGEAVAPGEIVSIFGSQMGPASGVAFSLENGRVPTSLGGTQVLVNGQPTPLLYVSASQINAILPFDLQTRPPC